MTPSDPISLNAGSVAIPEQPAGERDLSEVVLAPEFSVGRSAALPGWIVVEVAHPRHGGLTFLLPDAEAVTLSDRLARNLSR